MPAPAASDHADPALRPLAWGFTALIGVTTIQIVLGALVRANGAGLACPDWPLCFGQLVPAFDVKVAFEWSHRLLAMIGVNFGFTALAVLAYRDETARTRLGRWLWIGAALLIAQNILGGLTVLQLLASWTVTAHLLFGNAFNAVLLVCATALFTQPATRPPRPTKNARHIATAGALLLLLQLILGGLVSSRYAGLACPDWPSCIGGEWFPSFEGALGLHLFHRWNAIAFVACTWWSVFALRGEAAGRIALLGAGLATLQALVGISNVVLRLPVEVTGLHSALAALLVLATAWLLREVWTRPAQRADARAAL